MKKRILSGAFCLLLLFQLSTPPAGASSGLICFMAAGDSILPLSDRTMPFWQGGHLYIDSAIFTDSGSSSGRTALRVSRTVTSDGQLVLYGNERSLWFEPGLDHGYDPDGGIYYPGCVVRSGELFVPAAAVAQFFDLLYSVTDVQLQSQGQRVRGSLVWIRHPGFVMEDREFFAAATFAIASRYEEYVREKESHQVPVDEEPDRPVQPEIQGRRVYLCLMAGEGTSGVLDILDRCHAQAAFFCDGAFLEQQGGLLRRMAVRGQSVGILADAADTERSVAEQLEAGNAALERATCGRSRLAMIRNAGEEDLRAARELGFRCLEADLNRGGYELQSSAGAAALFRRIAAQRGDVSVWLGDRASAGGLRMLLTEMEEDADIQYLAWTETS